ncbi:MAG: cobyrinate a,c-diamide synthase [Gammaproteobacteria bacterium]|nr:cobyrinate a,c-diamide synthase [Gammaproteobacteria bacterium]
MPSLFISAAHKSSGKTTVAIGLCAAFAQRGLRVQPFKKGPDYIDPMWLGQAAGRACYNLDFYTMARDEIAAAYAQHAHAADVALIEGNKGLYDGLDLDGSNSNAALAKLLRSPVVLVIDAQGMTRGIAPLILGYQAFDRDVHIAGVILNQLGGRRHESKLRAVIEHYTDVPVLGAILRDPEMEIVERHLGLMPSNEAPQAAVRIAAIAQRVAEQVDLDGLLKVSAAPSPKHAQSNLDPSLNECPTSSTPSPCKGEGRDGGGLNPLPPCNDHPHPSPPPERGSESTISSTSAPARVVRLGIARDAAFGFYYPDDLAALQHAGAQLIPINTLRDATLPGIDGLFIGGGFPETHMAALEANTTLRSEIRAAIENGLPAYAECGGLMYLARRITWQEKSHAMVGVIPGDIVMHARPQGRGYVRLRESAQHPWPLHSGMEIPAHEFHYSSLDNLAPGVVFAYEVMRGSGVDGAHDGLIYKNLLASYTHLRDVNAHRWAQRFVEFVRLNRNSTTQSPRTAPP